LKKEAKTFAIKGFESNEVLAELAARLRSTTPPQKTDAADLIRAARGGDYSPSV
jgi:hypothetical protein